MTAGPVVGLVVGLVASVSAAVTGTVVVVSAPADAVVARAASGTPTADAQRCAAPALAPGIRVPRRLPYLAGQSSAETRRLAAVVERGRSLGLPGRAQAIALSVYLAAHDSTLPAYRIGAHPERLSAGEVYRRLQDVAGWRTRPPAVVGHQILGSPDPYVLVPYWDRAVSMLAQLTGTSAVDVSATVATGARARRGCDPTATARRGFPLPAGTGYAVHVAPARTTHRHPHGAPVTSPTKGAPSASASASGAPSVSAAATALAAPTQIEAPCGTPVLAASAGTVHVERDVAGAGPWLIRVTGATSTTTYANVGRPLVADGAAVLVGTPLATVADYAIDRCALGFGVARSGSTLAPAEALTWLAQSVLPTAPAAPPPPATTTLRMATQNVLGSHLTTGRGSEKPGYASGPVRMRAGLNLIEASGASIVNFQEFESPAAAVVTADGRWGLFRATPNNVFRDGNTNGNAIAWRTDTWEEVSETEFTVPWQVTLHMPVVTLRNRATDAEVVVIGVHNPASTARQGDQARARAVAVTIEKAMVSSIETRTGLPILLAGDMNDHTSVVCAFAAIGLRPHLSGHACGAYGGVDYIFGTGPIEMADLSVDRATLGRISDHPLVTSEVVLNP